VNPVLEGTVAVLTGSSRGIGLAVARAYAAHGARVVLNGREGAAVDDAVAQIVGAGGSAVGVVGSAADPAVAADLRRTAEQAFGPVDVLVTCAGAPEPPGSSILTISLADWHDLLDAHLTSTFVAAREFAPGMVERGRGAIVATSSHAFTGMYGGTGYAAGKGGVNSLVLAMAADLREHGVRVNAVCPGARTRLSTGDEYEAQMRDLHARGILDAGMLAASLDPAPPEYVAPTYVLLGSDLAAEVTGQILIAAGGFVGRFGASEQEFLLYRDHAADPPWTPEEIAASLT
jgi:3-oxoacyl-[acyl-carrier protein] reductase